MKENKKIKISLKVLITIIVVAILTMTVTAIYMLRNNKENSNDKIISKAEKLYGNDFCKRSLSNNPYYEDKEHSLIGCTVMTPYKCEICGKRQMEGSSPAPQICKECATITNRCRDCGKLLKKQ